VGLSLTKSNHAAVFAGLPHLAARKVSPARRAEIFQTIEDIIASRRFRVIGDNDDQQIWQKGWAEVAATLKGAHQVTLDALKPQYFHQGVELRLLGDYWMPQTDYFEYWVGIAVRRLLMLHAFDNPKRIVELGCGTGMNLIIAAELFAAAELAGSDWAPASVQILDAATKSLGRNIRGVLYDMFTGEGSENLPIDSDTCVITVHALEQLGGALQQVTKLLIERKPRCVLHIEPILDFYDRDNPYDDIAARYHLTRGYLQGLVVTLEGYAAEKRVEILSRGRVRLGNLYHEAYSFMIWKPL